MNCASFHSSKTSSCASLKKLSKHCLIFISIHSNHTTCKFHWNFIKTIDSQMRCYPYRDDDTNHPFGRFFIEDFVFDIWNLILNGPCDEKARVYLFYSWFCVVRKSMNIRWSVNLHLSLFFGKQRYFSVFFFTALVLHIICFFFLVVFITRARFRAERVRESVQKRSTEIMSPKNSTPERESSTVLNGRRSDWAKKKVK